MVLARSRGAVLSLAAVLALAACQSTIPGDPTSTGGPTGGTGEPATLEFRPVVGQPVPDGAAPPPSGPTPSPTPPPTGSPPRSVARQPAVDAATACGVYKTDHETYLADTAAGRPSAITPDRLAAEARDCRQHPALAPGADGPTLENRTAQQSALATLACQPGTRDPLAGKTDPDRPLATCDGERVRYVLDRPILTGDDVAEADAFPDQSGAGWTVGIRFTSAGERAWADFTADNTGKQVAFVVDGTVISAPTIQEAILSGETRITGSFTKQEAEELAGRLRPR